MATTPIALNSIFDSRDVLDRLDRATLDGATDDEVSDLIRLRDEMDETFGFQALQDGITIIPDDGFEDYARQTAEDLGLINQETAWPATHIDWEAAASALQMDYTAFEFDGVTYWGRE